MKTEQEEREHCDAVAELRAAKDEREHANEVAREVAKLLGVSNPWCENGRCGCGPGDCRGPGKMTLAIQILLRERAAARAEALEEAESVVKSRADSMHSREFLARRGGRCDACTEASAILGLIRALKAVPR